MARATYVWFTAEKLSRLTGKRKRSGDWVDLRKFRSAPVARGPEIVTDIQPYRSMADGSYVGGRRQHRDHLRAHGCVEVGNEPMRAPRETPMPPAALDVQRAMEQGPSPRQMEALYRARNAVPGAVPWRESR